jgi:hypothetical protein
VRTSATNLNLFNVGEDITETLDVVPCPHLALLCPWRECTTAAGWLSYGISQVDGFRQQPADLQVGRPTKCEGGNVGCGTLCEWRLLQGTTPGIPRRCGRIFELPQPMSEGQSPTTANVLYWVRGVRAISSPDKRKKQFDAVLSKEGTYWRCRRSRDSAQMNSGNHRKEQR